MSQGAVMASGFGQKLKALRGRAGVTQEALARTADISLSAVTKLESGKVDPTWTTVLRLAKALKVSVQAFTDDEPPADVAGAEPGPEPATDPEPTSKKKGGKK